MSNPEVEPRETECTAASAGRGIQIIEPRDVPLGGLRAMDVRRTLPQRARSLIGAWCFLDHYGPDDVAETGGMNVPAHPHTGLQTVSWLFSGEIEHRDSAGFHAMVRPGELNLMTAGNGISHSERSTPETTILHGAQLWVVLPESARHEPRGFAHYEPPIIEGPGWAGQVFLGELLGSESPVTTYTPLVGAEIRLEPGTALEFGIDPDFEHGVLVDVGDAAVLPLAGDAGAGSGSGASPTSVAKDHLAYVPPGSDGLRIEAGDAPTRVLLIGGEPFAESIVMWWNFIGRDHEDVVRARADWQAQLAAAGVADVAVEGAPGPAVAAEGARDAGAGELDPDRYGLPDGEPEPPLSAPPLPIARLKPREQ